MQRRSFLKAGLAAGALGLMGSRTRLLGQTPTGLTRYVDPLPIPSTLQPTAGINHVVMSQFSQKLHRDLPPTQVWGYNGTYPGPTIEVTRGTPASFLWDSQLPPNHLLAGAVDHRLHGCDMG